MVVEFICNETGLIMVWFEAIGFHLSQNTLDNVLAFQGQERDEEVHQATLSNRNSTIHLHKVNL